MGGGIGDTAASFLSPHPPVEPWGYHIHVSIEAIIRRPLTAFWPPSPLHTQRFLSRQCHHSTLDEGHVFGFGESVTWAVLLGHILILVSGVGW